MDSLIENLPNMVFVKDAKELKFVRFNKAGEDILGISREELIGKNDYDFFPAGEARHFVEDDRKVLEGSRIVDIPEEFIQTRHQGVRTLHTKKIPVLDADGKPEYLLGISEDITELKKAQEINMKLIREEAASKERELASQKIAFLSEASKALSSSLDYRVSMGSLSKMLVPAFADWCTMGISKDQDTLERVVTYHHDPNKAPLIDQLKNLNPSISAFKSAMSQLLRTGHTVFIPDVSEGDLRRYSKDNETIELIKKIGNHSMVIVPIRMREKQLGGIAFIMSDSDRKFKESDISFLEELGVRTGFAIENSLLYETAQEAVRAREEFLSIASHELKTPITSLNILLEMSRKLIDAKRNALLSSDRFGQIMELCRVQSKRITDLIDDLMDVSRMKSGKMKMEFEDCDLGEMVRVVLGQFSDYIKSSGSDVVVRCEKNVSIRCDRFRVEQVILNLLSNAVKYGAKRPIEISVRNFNNFGQLEIMDHGIGIPNSMLDKIFERFERTASAQKISGLGLGLYISKEIILAHGGRIYVSSKESEGSTFMVEIPLLLPHFDIP